MFVNRKLTVVLAGVVSAFTLAPAYAQVQAKKPVPYERSGEPEVREAPPGLRHSLGRVARTLLARPSEAEMAVLSTKKDPPLIGINRDVPREAVGAGRWAELPEGGAVWRWSIQSPDASGMRIWFENFNVGKGKVWVYSEGRSADSADGPYTGQGPFEDGRFWTATVPGESVMIEFVPEGGQRLETAPFEVRRVGHLFRTLEEAVAESTAQAGALRSSTRPGENPITVGPLATHDPAELCNLDVACYPQWTNTARATALVLITVAEGQAACSGTLLATRNNSQKAYFLTANHCVESEAEARSVDLFFTYQANACRGPAPADRGSARATGANLLVATGLGNGDASLLLLRSVPSGVVFSGWDPGDPGIGSHFTVIHHPAGSYKRISIGTRVGDRGAQIGGDILPPEHFYQVAVTQGILEPGSSGGGAFTSDGILAAVVSYGPVAPSLCDIRPTVEGLGRFSSAYPLMSDYLEDRPFTAVRPSVTRVDFRINNGFFTSAASQRVSVTTESRNPVNFSVRADAEWVKLSAVAGSASASTPGTFDITVVPGFFKKPGAYQTTVTISSGSAPLQFVNVHAQVTADRSDVLLSVSPSPVVASEPDADGARWTFRIRLEERGGKAATRVTSVRINALDYSSRIPDWFGGDRIAAGAAIEATLRAANLAVPTEMVVEVGGVDDSTGETWYRTLAVPFR